ncbi:MAG: FAD-dependent oxidoreductase [Gammaproteobacteria bacterium]
MSGAGQAGRFPAHASVAVIGGGVIGCSTLYHLAKSGVDAVLLERHKLTSGTTWHSAAQVRALRSSRNLTALIRYSIDLYKTLERETGQSTGWIQRGSLSIATNPERLIHIKRQEALARLFGVTAHSVTPGEAAMRWPLMNARDVLGAVWSPDDGRVSPSDLCAALAKGARARGGKIFEDANVTAICTKNGAVAGLETNRGAIRCDAIALCSGLWSRNNAAMAGAEAPLWPCEHFYLLTKPVEGLSGHLPTLSDHDGRLYIRDDSGGLLVGCFEPAGKPLAAEALGENAPFALLPEDWEHFEPMMENALHRVPSLAHAEVRMLLNGPESFTPDGMFLLGESAETAGLFLGCGMNSVGVASGGGAGMALAHCIVHGHPPADLHEADPKRFPACMNSAAALAARAPEVLGEHYAIAHPGKQWASARNLRTAPLHSEWREAGAHFGQFFGWERPLYFAKPAEPALTFGRPDWFAQVGEEVRIAHERAALFDLSTFGKIRITGAHAERFLQRACANDMCRPPGRVIYTAMLNSRGGFESDLTALRLARDEYLLYTGTAAIRRDLAWLKRHLRHGEKVRIADVTEQYAVLGLMGADARTVARRAGADALNHVAYFHHATCEIAGAPVRGVRMSYVGEPGWEITCAAKDAAAVFGALRQAGARPAGLFAQTSMRIEKQFLAYGHDLDSDINPLQAGLDFALNWHSDFIGREALLALRGRPMQSVVAGIVLRDADARPLGNEPVCRNGKIIGNTTSAAYGYRIGAAVALALVAAEAGMEGTPVEVDIAGRLWPGRIIRKPAYDPEGSRMKAG